MLDEQRALQLIYAAVDEINGQLPPGQRLQKTPETVLLGDGAALDSLAFVNLLVAVEGEVERAGGPAVGLLDELGKADGDTPLRTIGSIASHVAQTARAAA
jgi:D-alanine--poly(phosphoribitol) ligase subunit 2